MTQEKQNPLAAIYGVIALFLILYDLIELKKGIWMALFEGIFWPLFAGLWAFAHYVLGTH